jgi:hypothetical protein
MMQKSVHRRLLEVEHKFFWRLCRVFCTLDYFLLFVTLVHISSSASLASPAGKPQIEEMALSAYS